eukprot:TRINITY_DN4779_c0_g1_i1.p1 TRINITY_DN4779_c0_g1~~TRINITY_DN4779_c0_g1_i1.p1  ORF type:complete len:856 (+),score=115.95 TRINITY_DN4779_c0_g1_i1:214-2781(+)
MWWWDVRGSGEVVDPARRSLANESEGKAVVALVVHLVRCGVLPSRIAVLASYTAQVDRIKKQLEQAVALVFDGGWPSDDQHGVAARKQLDKLATHDATAVAAQQCIAISDATAVAAQQCIAISETFLKLGDVPQARRALGVASTFGADTTNHAGWVDVLMCQRGMVEECISNSDPDFSIAVGALTSLTTLAAEWRAAGAVAAAAAACVELRRLAREIQGGIELTDGKRSLVYALSKKAESHLEQLVSLNTVTVSSIDRYQGSENDVVVVSLVRSNPEHDIGFLKERARCVVAQSRARVGMYFVGDRETFCKSNHWRELGAAMQSHKRIGDTLPLCCPRHRSSRLDAKWGDADQIIEEGFCAEKCRQEMACGEHVCERTCHGGDEGHAICQRKMKDVCEQGHGITRLCFQIATEVKCVTCERVETERREKEQREIEQLEAAARRKCEELCDYISKQPSEPTIVELSKHGEHVVEFVQVMDRTEKYVQADHNIPIVVSRIQKITNPQLELEFIQAQMGLHSGPLQLNSQMLFHGTGPEGVEGIPRTGFRDPDWSDENMFGRGTYFATDSSKSAQQMYTKGSGCLLLCEVLLGKVCSVPGLASKHPLKQYVRESQKGRRFLDVDHKVMQKEGFDSVFAPRDTRNNSGVKYDEMIVYNPAHAIPRYIVHFNGQADQPPKWRTPAAGGCRMIKAADVTAQDSKELREFYFATGQYMRLLGSSAEPVTRVDVYESASVRAKFNAKREQFVKEGKSKEAIWVFHGTDKPENVPKICMDGFKIGGQDGHAITHGDVHGQGVYTAKGPQTPVGYASSTNQVILCLALPGAQGERGLGDSWLPRGDDWVVFKSSEQLLPTYVVHY